MIKKIQDKEIVRLLQSSNPKKETLALRYLHQRVYKMIVRFVKRLKGNAADAEDVMQEGLFIFFDRARTNKLPEQLNAEAYLYGICQKLWYRKLKKKPDTDDLSDVHHTLPVEDMQIKMTLEDEKAHLMSIIENRLGESCYKMLVYFYYEQRRMKEIAQLFSYKNEQIAKNKKAKCMKKLKEMMMEEPTLKKAFQ